MLFLFSDFISVKMCSWTTTVSLTYIGNHGVQHRHRVKKTWPWTLVLTTINNMILGNLQPFCDSLQNEISHLYIAGISTTHRVFMNITFDHICKLPSIIKQSFMIVVVNIFLFSSYGTDIKDFFLPHLQSLLLKKSGKKF